jgi:type I restriction enzyme S subunit
MIPAEWTIEPLDKLVEYDSGRTPARGNATYWEGDDADVPWVAISDMKNYGTISRTREKITRRAFDDVFRRRIVLAGTLLMSFKLTIGRVSTLGIDACHNEAIISIRPKARVDQRYLGYFLSQVDYDDLQDRQIKGNTLNQDKIDRIPVILPPKWEQCEIANVLDRVREAITLETKAHEVASSLKRTAMRDLFTRGLRQENQKDTDIGSMPESWQPRTVLDLCHIHSGGTPRKSVGDYWIGEIPWASGKDLKVPTLYDTIDHISQDGVDAGSRLAPADAVLILVRGMGLAKDLPVAVISRPMAFNQDLKALVSRGEFSGTYIRSAIHCAKDRLLSRIVPSAHGTMTLNLDDIETFKIPCPSDPAEAVEIVEILNAIDCKIDLHSRKRVLLENLFKALLHKLMAGEIRVADLDLPALGKALVEGVAY